MQLLGCPDLKKKQSSRASVYVLDTLIFFKEVFFVKRNTHICRSTQTPCLTGLNFREITNEKN
ncbi:hypothetical protein I79_021152 [Cricetulus griseus]|uniref:Uncharacterized protein n=1 Tax=Cricetulus griseus TaxID=10029 RepID=G3IBW9_CRIGR|nr:hypothetical protein I79_021152 [Cricetulus griseus]